MCDLCGVEASTQPFHVQIRIVAGPRARTVARRVIAGNACAACSRRFDSFRRLRVAGIILGVVTISSFLTILEADLPPVLLIVSAAALIAFIVVMARLAGWHRRTVEDVLGGPEAVDRQLALVPEAGALLERTFVTIYPGQPQQVDAWVSEIRRRGVGLRRRR